MQMSPGPDGHIPDLTNNTLIDPKLPEQLRINLGLPQLSNPGLFTYTVGWATGGEHRHDNPSDVSTLQ